MVVKPYDRKVRCGVLLNEGDERELEAIGDVVRSFFELSAFLHSMSVPI